jgi:sugar lactone lactonase YvrE
MWQQFGSKTTIAILSILIVACGGGGGGSTPATNAGGVTSSSTTASTPSGNTTGGTGTSGSGTSGTTAATFAYDSTARFNAPAGVKSDAAGNLYVLDSGNSAIRKIAPDGSVSTLARDLPYVAPDFDVDGTGNVYLVNDHLGGEIYKITPDGTRTIVAQNLFYPMHPAVDAQGNVYVTSAATTGRTSSAIQRIAPDGQVSLIYIGDLYHPLEALAIDPSGTLYTIDRDVFPYTSCSGNCPEITTGRILKIVPGAAPIEFATLDFRIVPEDATISDRIAISNITLDSTGNLYIGLYRDHRSSTDCFSETSCEPYSSGMSINKVTPAGVITRLRTGPPGDTTGDYAQRRYDGTYGISYIGAGRDGNIYATYERNNTVYRISQAGEATLFAGKPGEAGFAD